MTKTKRQLRAEAVERLKTMNEDPTFGYVAVAALDRPVSGREWKDALVDLLTEDEAPETHMALPVDMDGVPVRPRDEMVLADGSVVKVVSVGGYYGDAFFTADRGPFTARCYRHHSSSGEVVEVAPNELPEGDAVAILRKVAADKTSVSSDDLLRYAVGSDMVPQALETLADMVDRDYVRRDEHDQSIGSYERRSIELNDALKAIRERFGVDTRWSAEDAAKMVLEAVERDYVRREYHCDVVGDSSKRFARMLEERDYWRRQVQACMDAAYPPSGSASYAPGVMAYLAKDSCTDAATMVCAVIDGLRDEVLDKVAAIVRLTAERDGWKAMAEHDGVKRSNYGAWQGMTNREWLMAERLDADGTCPNGNGTETAESVRQADLPDTDCGQGADMSGNAPDCVRNDDFMSENGVSADAEGSNDANESQIVEHAPGRSTNGGEMLDDAREKLSDCSGTAEAGTSQVPESENIRNAEKYSLEGETGGGNYTADENTAGKKSPPKGGPGPCGQPSDASIADTREKLEADVLEWCRAGNAVFPKSRAGKICEWLDRQAAITERECSDAFREYRARKLGITGLADLQAELEAARRERDDCADAADKAEAELKRERAQREHWQHVASKHAAEVQRLKAEAAGYA